MYRIANLSVPCLFNKKTLMSKLPRFANVSSTTNALANARDGAKAIPVNSYRQTKNLVSSKSCVFFVVHKRSIYNGFLNARAV